MLELFEGPDGPKATLRFIEEKGGVGLWSWDLQSRKHGWSAGIFALLGVSPDTHTPSYELFNSLVHPEDRRPPGEIEHILQNALPIDRTFRIIRPDGRQRWMLSRGEILVDATGRPIRAIGIFFDVTHHHEQLQSLRISEDRFNVLVRTLRAAIWTARSDGTVSNTLNWAELTGEDPLKFHGTGWLDYVHPDDRAHTMQAWEAAIRTRKPYDVEHRGRTADGSYHWYKSRAYPVLNDDGSIREWLGVSVDIHDSKAWPTQSGPAEFMTGAQLRGARGIVNWSVRDLAEAAKVSPSTIRRLEEIDGAPTGSEPSLPLLRAALEQAGVEFLFPPSGKPGLRPRSA
ncbi:MAG: PAS domain-containing protein [Pseudorhodoplanes sp.]